MAVKDLTPERLRELLHYNPETGVFTWVAKSGIKATAIRVGDQAGNLTEEGYRRIYIGKTQYKEHRLAWMYCFGAFPDSILDHINGDRADNRIANLRLATRGLNAQNRLKHTRAKTKLLGVWLSRTGTYCAKIGVTLAGRKLQLNLGTYDSAAKAHEVYEAAKALLHPGARITEATPPAMS